MVNVLDILKNVDSPTAPKPPEAPEAPSGPTSGPGSKPRGGKYIRRWWEGDHWEYEYSDEPGENHGLTQSHEDSHTLEAQAETPEQQNLLEEAQSGGPSANRAAKELYNQTRESKTSPGQSHEWTAPDGQKFIFKVVNNAKSPTGKTIHVLDGEGKKVAKKDLPRGVKASANSWAGVEAFQKGISQIEDIGNGTATIVPSFKVDDKSDQIVQSGWQAFFPPGSPFYTGDKKKDRIYKTPKNKPFQTREDLLNYIGPKIGLSEKLKEAESKESKRASEILESGMSASEALKQDMLPKVQGESARGGHGGRFSVQNHFSSPQEKHDFVSKVVEENEKAITSGAKRAGVDAADVSTIIDSPDSIEYKAVESAVRNFDPSKGKSLEDHISASVYSMHRQKGAAMPTSSSEESDSDTYNPAEARAAQQVAAGGSAQAGGGMGDLGEGIAVQDEASLDEADQFITDQKEGHVDAYQNFLSSGGTQAEQIASYVGLDEAVSNLQQAKTSSQFKEALTNYYSKIQQLEQVNIPSSALLPGNSLYEQFKQTNKALKAMLQEYKEAEELRKAYPQYSHKEGPDYNPKFFFKDPKGNLTRFTNAPSGHPDESSMFGEAQPHPYEPDYNKTPQFYSPDGRKLYRAPYPGAPVEWNQSYHPQDPKNLWAGRWVNPVTGSHEYTYLENDIYANPPAMIHKQNALVDVRLPVFRRYSKALLSSMNVKDTALGLMLMFIDQGRIRVRELCALNVGDVKLGRDFIILGKRQVHIDATVRKMLHSLMGGRAPEEPLFAVPTVDVEGGLNPEEMRRLGPHLITNVMEELGIPVESLQTYHATQTYSMMIQEIMETHDQADWRAAHHFALLEVASEMGHNLDYIEDVEYALVAIERSMVDPIVKAAIKANADKYGFSGGNSKLQCPVRNAVPHVSSNLVDRTEEEKEFSRWLHSAPIHLYLELVT